jgi:hypothetical protein
MGLIEGDPHNPLQAAELIEPVEPWDCPITGANEKGKFLVPNTLTVLHWSPDAGRHGMEQIDALHLEPV